MPPEMSKEYGERLGGKHGRYSARRACFEKRQTTTERANRPPPGQPATPEPFRWDEERRFLLRCELDAAHFHLYGIPCDDVDYIMDTFPIVKRKDEAAHSEYRTKRVILSSLD